MKSICNSKRRAFLTRMGIISALPVMLPIDSLASQLKTLVAGRRIVTGQNNSGKSIILCDGLVPENARSSDPDKNNSFSELWVERKVPVKFDDFKDPLKDYSPTTEPPPGGVAVRIITWGPGFSYPAHSTLTLDFIFVISGRLEIILDEGSAILSPGDTLIQRGTNHGWKVIGDDPCTFVAVLLSAAN